jgi:putative transposase
MPNYRRAILREAVATTRQSHPFAIDAFVILPDHLHAIWSLPAGNCDFSTRWRLIKSRNCSPAPSPQLPLAIIGGRLS